MEGKKVLGVDIGASSALGMLGKFDGDKLYTEEINRFPNQTVNIMGNLYWDILKLFQDILYTLGKIRTKNIESLGINTWGVDFGLLDKRGKLLGNLRSYRDNRTDSIEEIVTKKYSRYEIFSKTGMSPYQISTLYQLIAMKISENSILSCADQLLFTSGIINYFLTGNKNCEKTQASTSLLYSPFTSDWAYEFKEKYSLPDILPQLSEPGKVIGNLTADISKNLGIKSTPVISVAEHDTASAIASVPANTKQDVIYISCGTWSVVGSTVQKPIIKKEAMEQGFHNEIGYNDEIMFVKNIIGLWVLQECIKEWVEEGFKIDYQKINREAQKCNFDSVIDLEHEDFLYPGMMSKKIKNYCHNNNIQIPNTRTETYKCIVISLAEKYKQTIKEVEKLTGKSYSKINIIGGGARNSYLCQLTAEITGKQVIAGPYEATSIGNIIVQLIALGEIANITEAREVIKRSFDIKTYIP